MKHLKALIGKHNIGSYNPSKGLCVIYTSWYLCIDRIVDKLDATYAIGGNKIKYAIIEAELLEKAKSCITKGAYIIWHTNMTDKEEVRLRIKNISHASEIKKFAELIEENVA